MKVELEEIRIEQGKEYEYTSYDKDGLYLTNGNMLCAVESGMVTSLIIQKTSILNQKENIKAETTGSISEVFALKMLAMFNKEKHSEL